MSNLTATTMDAWDAIQDDLPKMRAAVYSFVYGRGEHGATIREVVEYFGRTDYSHAPRCTELYQTGMLIRNGERRVSDFSGTGRGGWVLVAPEFAPVEEDTDD